MNENALIIIIFKSLSFLLNSMEAAQKKSFQVKAKSLSRTLK
jgi:hypothetical protein